MRLYVKNLPPTCTAETLRRLCEAYGRVSSAQIAADPDTGRCTGSGFIEMPEASQALHALAQLNGTSLGGATITVVKAYQQGSRSAPRQEGPRARTPRWH